MQNFIQNYIWLVPLLPLLGVVLNGIPTALGFRLPRTQVHLVACGVMLLAFLVVATAFVQLLGLPAAERSITVHLWDWIHVGALKADIAFLIDPLSTMMMGIITGIGFLIHVYSMGYMHEEPAYARFFTYLNFFVFMMLLLVMGNNLFLLFVGWEGVGLCSYLLIGFWFKEKANGAAGMKAFLTNRVGDFGLMIGLMTLYWLLVQVGQPTVVFAELKNAVPLLADKTFWGVSAVTFICLFLFIGATGKSAQIPLYVWLPDAMAGPTPVSGLIHAATMVTAGVYMIARMNWLFDMSETALLVIGTVGAITALFAATIGFAQNDIKKVLAYSTVSQLGYMFLGLSTGTYSAGVFHLMTHAFFKACLFLGSGSVIMGMHHEQDMRLMGGLRKSMPVTFWTFMLATIAIGGVFPFSGFFSKDEILWLTFSKGHENAWYYVLWALGMGGAICTAFYMMRCVTLTFFGELRANDPAIQKIVSDEKAVLAAQAAIEAARPVEVSPGFVEPEHHHDDHGHAHAHAAHGDHGHTDHGHDDHGHGHHGPLVPHESPFSVTFALSVLAALSVFGGLLNVPFSVQKLFGLHGSGLLNEWLAPVIPLHAHHEVHAIEYILMVVSVAVALTSMFLGYKFYIGKKEKVAAFVKKFPNLFDGALNKYYVDEFYFATVVGFVLWIRHVLARFDRLVIDGLVNFVGLATEIYSRVVGWFDKTFVDGLVNLSAWTANQSGGQLKRLQTGNIQHYAFGALLGVVLVLGFKLLFG